MRAITNAMTADQKRIPAFHSARRINQSLTASIEKRVLLWIAIRLPRGITSDQLTFLGFGAQIGAGACFAIARWHRGALLAVIACIALNWLGDSLDGTVARVRQQQRPRYGFYVDHMIDLFGAIAFLGGLGCSGFLHWPTAAAMLIAFLLLSAESFLAARTIGRFHLSQGWFGPTELRILLVAGTLALLRSRYATVFAHRFLLFDLGGAIGALGMFALAVKVALRHAAQLYREEPLPPRPPLG
ncbi:MAG: CDP-alcohol phosphatidyltransferase family protein [Acidobacteriaceae bacterium]